MRLEPEHQPEVRPFPAPGQANPYATWAATHGASETTGDSDHDGIVNQLEFYLDGDPTAADASILPTVSVEGEHLTLSFMRRDVVENYGGGALIEWGSDLAGWTAVPLDNTSSGPTDAGVTVQVNENGSAPDSIVVAIPRALAIQGNLFARLKVTE